MKDIATDMRLTLISKKKFEDKGMTFSGLSPDSRLPEIIELNDHPGLLEFSFIQNLNLDL